MIPVEGFVSTILGQTISMNYKTKYLLIQVILIVSFWISGCRPEIMMINKQDQVQPLPILEPSKEWDSFQWLTSEQIYAVKRGPTKLDVEISIYNLRSDTWQPMEFSEIDCRGGIEHNHPLPDTRIGFIFECRDSSSADPIHYLIAWEPFSDKFEIIKQYPQRALGDIFHPGNFSVSPDMTIVIHDEAPGALQSKLFRVSLVDNSIEVISEDLNRAESPSWSVDGQQIAFGGNLEGSKRNNSYNIFSGLPTLRNIAYTPWNIYVIDTDGENVQEILSGITMLQFLKWNPSGKNQIAFSGGYNGQSGLWVYDLDDKQVVLLWATNTGNVVYDWSPDGDKMIVMDCRKRNGDEIGVHTCTPTIITVPSSTTLN